MNNLVLFYLSHLSKDKVLIKDILKYYEHDNIKVGRLPDNTRKYLMDRALDKRLSFKEIAKTTYEILNIKKTLYNKSIIEQLCLDFEINHKNVACIIKNPLIKHGLRRDHDYLIVNRQNDIKKETIENAKDVKALHCSHKDFIMSINDFNLTILEYLYTDEPFLLDENNYKEMVHSIYRKEAFKQKIFKEITSDIDDLKNANNYSDYYKKIEIFNIVKKAFYAHSLLINDKGIKFSELPEIWVKLEKEEINVFSLKDIKCLIDKYINSYMKILTE